MSKYVGESVGTVYFHCSKFNKSFQETVTDIWLTKFIRTYKKLIFLLHILLFELTRFSNSIKMTGMSKNILTSLRRQNWKLKTILILAQNKSSEGIWGFSFILLPEYWQHSEECMCRLWNIIFFMAEISHHRLTYTS